LKKILLIFIPFIVGKTYGQTDSIAYSKSLVLKEGIYFNFSDFKQNKAFPAQKINSDLDKSSIDFFSNLVQKKTILLKDSGKAERRISKDQLWGFCQNGSIYYQIKGDFIKIPILGRLSHFVHYTVTAGSGNSYAPFYYNNANFETTNIDEYIMDGSSGTLYDFSVKNMEKLLEADSALSAEFSQLKSKKKKDLKFLYVRKYNEKHPLYFFK